MRRLTHQLNSLNSGMLWRGTCTSWATWSQTRCFARSDGGRPSSTKLALAAPLPTASTTGLGLSLASHEVPQVHRQPKLHSSA